MFRLRRYIKRRLHRRIFFWFGATIVATALLVSGFNFLLSGFGTPAWRQDAQRFSRFVGHQFLPVWESSERREAFARSIAEDLDVRVTLKDSKDTVTAAFGPDCRRMAWSVPIEQDEVRLGAVEFCVPHRGSGGVKFFLSLMLALGVLWGASGKIARRIARPLGYLTSVTERIGEGELSARARFRGTDELGVLAKAIDDMAERIERQIQEQKTLLAAVSHELRTPLGHLRLLVEIARQDGGEVTRSALDDIDHEVQEIDQLVGELLASSRLDFTYLDTTPLEARSVAETAARRAGLDPDAIVDIEAGLTTVHADATLLARALANLLANAEKHGGGVHRLRIETGSEGVVFTVEDDGPGIPDSERERVFEPFYRGDGGGRGTLGLGLALVGRIARAHGGTAFARGREGGGAVVGFSVRSTPAA